jgi:hypothetical protein
MEHVLTLPFASPNAFFLTETETQEGRETILLSQAHHARSQRDCRWEGAECWR